MNPRKRAWFQLHLSTCIVLMVAAGALVWAILFRPSSDTVNYSLGYPRNDGSGMQDWYIERYYSYGYPVEFYSGHVRVSITIPDDKDLPALDGRYEDPLISDDLRRFLLSNPPWIFSGTFAGDWRALGLFINFLVFSAALLFTACACEWFIRRRPRARDTSGASGQG